MNFIVCKWYFTKAVKQQGLCSLLRLQQLSLNAGLLTRLSALYLLPRTIRSQLRFSLGCTWKYRTPKDSGARSISRWKHSGKAPFSESPRADSLTKKGALEFSSRESPPCHIYWNIPMARIQLHTARDFLPSSFCSKRTSTRLFLPPFCKKIHHRPFTQINLLMHLLLTLFWTFEFPSQQKSIECTLPSPILTGQISSCCRDASKVYCEGYWLIFFNMWHQIFRAPLLTDPWKDCSATCAQSCLTLWDPMDCGPPGSSVHRIFQARILEWVVISSSRGSSWPRDWTHDSCFSCISRQILDH